MNVKLPTTLNIRPGIRPKLLPAGKSQSMPTLSLKHIDPITESCKRNSGKRNVRTSETQDKCSRPTPRSERQNSTDIVAFEARQNEGGLATFQEGMTAYGPIESLSGRYGILRGKEEASREDGRVIRAVQKPHPLQHNSRCETRGMEVFLIYYKGMGRSLWELYNVNYTFCRPHIPLWELYNVNYTFCRPHIPLWELYNVNYTFCRPHTPLWELYNVNYTFFRPHIPLWELYNVNYTFCRPHIPLWGQCYLLNEGIYRLDTPNFTLSLNYAKQM